MKKEQSLRYLVHDGHWGYSCKQNRCGLCPSGDYNQGGLWIIRLQCRVAPSDI